MSKVRPDKAATVKEVKSRVKATSTTVVTEYRGMTVAQISTLRRQLRTLNADFKVYKNTLVLRAIAGSAVESLSEFLQGPTAITFIDGDVSAVAKALRDFARETPTLIVKGGVADGKALTFKALLALAHPAEPRRPARPVCRTTGLAAAHHGQPSKGRAAKLRLWP